MSVGNAGTQFHFGHLSISKGSDTFVKNPQSGCAGQVHMFRAARMDFNLEVPKEKGQRPSLKPATSPVRAVRSPDPSLLASVQRRTPPPCLPVHAYALSPHREVQCHSPSLQPRLRHLPTETTWRKQCLGPPRLGHTKPGSFCLGRWGAAGI